MADPFHSPKRRVSRAKKHVRDLERQIHAFMDEKPYGNVVEVEADGITFAHKIKFTQPLPESLIEVAADAIDNLRSALDQAGYASEAGGKIDPKHAYFPFAADIPSFDNVVQGRCKDLPPDIKTLFRSFKAYKGGDANKHRLLTPIGIATGGMHIGHATFEGGALKSIQVPIWDREKHEIVLIRTRQSVSLNYDLQVTFAVAFDKVDIVGGHLAVPVLDALASKVQSIFWLRKPSAADWRSFPR